MGKILADTAALLEGFDERRRDRRRLGIIEEIRPDAMHEIRRAVDDRRSGRKALASIWVIGSSKGTSRLGIDEMGRRGRSERVRGEGLPVDLLPRLAGARQGRLVTPDIHARAGFDTQPAMRCLQHEIDDAVAEEVLPLDAHHG